MMDTATMERGVLKAKVTQTPTDGQGIFDFEVYCFEVDSDNERIKNFSNVGTGKPALNIPLDYQHTPEEADPLGTIGTARVKQEGDHLAGTAKLDIDSNPMAVAVYERLLLPEGDPARLSEVSIFYAYEVSKAFEGPKGELVQVDCELLGMAVVHRGAQRTRVTNVKEEKTGSVGTVTVDVVPRFIGWPDPPLVYGTDTADATYTVSTDKAGRTLNAKNEAKLRQASDLLTEVLASVRSTSETDEPKAEEAKAEEPETAKAEEPPEPTELDLIRARVAGLG